MSNFAPVCPIHMYKQLKEKGPEHFGDYFLLLAHDVVKHPKEYQEVFLDAKDYTIIMDNSVIELGTAVDHGMLRDACGIVDADVLAIPDVLEDGEGTIKASSEFLDVWNPQGMSQTPELMFIPQGSDLDDYVGCVMRACDLNIPMDWIGIARNVTDRIIHSRLSLAGFFAVLQPTSKLHLLGFSRDTSDDILCATSPLVEGIDSAVPVRTQQRISKHVYITDPGPRNTWWEEGVLEPFQLDNLEVIRNRIKLGGK